MFIHFLDFIDEDYIPLVISRGIITEKSDIRPINNASAKTKEHFLKICPSYIPLTIKIIYHLLFKQELFLKSLKMCHYQKRRNQLEKLEGQRNQLLTLNLPKNLNNMFNFYLI